MPAIEYGTVAIVPKGTWSNVIQYDVGNLVEKEGSSYVAKSKPPIGNLPTDTNYWQVSAQGGNKATSSAVGVVKPDNSTIAVDANGTISAKIATTSANGISRPDGTTIAISGTGIISIKAIVPGDDIAE